MKNDELNLSQEDIIALESRWNQKPPDSDETALQQMIQQLKTQCKKHRPERPLALDLRGITLFNEDLSDLDLSGYDFSYANLNQSDLTGTIFSYSKFYKTSLEKAKLDECEFIGSDLSYASLNECSAVQCGFGGADLSNTSIINANLSHASLSHSKLINADMRASNLEKARISEADLSGSIFTRSKLVKSDLKKSNVQDTNFELADMRGCRLLGIKNFKKAKWIGTDIRDLDLRGAYLVRRYIADENYLYEFQSSSHFHKFIYLLWWASSDCGRSLLRWFVWLSIITLVFAAIYSQLNIDYGDSKTFFSPIYFSVVTVTTLGYGDILPVSFIAQFIVTLQAITGYMGLGGLLSILGNKMARRAE